MLPIFQPENNLVFRPLPEQFRVIGEMFYIYHRQIQRGYLPEVALYEAYVRTHQTDYGIATSVGHVEFHRRMSEYLRMAMRMVETVVEKYLHPFQESLGTHNTIVECLDPIETLQIAGENPDPKADSLQNRLHFEARRQMGIALQLFAVEEADHSLGVAADLTQIDKLSREKLFLGISRNLWIVKFQDTEKDHQIVNVHFFANKEEARLSTQNKSIPPHILRTVKAYMCRVAQMGQLTYIIFADPRYKREFATILKLERGRSLSDRRGWQYVVMGVEEKNKLRVATREDAEYFLEHTRKTLWQDPLIPNGDLNTPNPHRDPSYWDCKITGYYHRRDRDRIVAGPAEQLVTTGMDYLNATYARLPINHELYRARQIDHHLCELWFPYTGDKYTDVLTNFQSPHYEVDWDSTEVREQLDEWRINQI